MLSFCYHATVTMDNFLFTTLVVQADSAKLTVSEEVYSLRMVSLLHFS
ncbi:MAG: hypothetical protein ABR572_00405 [Cryomorphaceae bacterium]|nr:hypothetical protein [Flavobacteriales bacterium]